jgi:hypothetical protein
MDGAYTSARTRLWEHVANWYQACNVCLLRSCVALRLGSVHRSLHAVLHQRHAPHRHVCACQKCHLETLA